MIVVPGPECLFTHATAPSEERFYPVQNGSWVKPKKGGMYTTPRQAYGKDEPGQAWRTWCMWEMPEWNEGKSDWILVPEEDTRLLVIDGWGDLKDMLYRHKTVTEWGQTVPNFESLAREYDGLWLTDDGQWDTRLTEPSLYGWDLETVFWFRWAFKQVIPVLEGEVLRGEITHV